MGKEPIEVAMNFHLGILPDECGKDNMGVSADQAT
jgi:hypothetical protein